MEKEMPSPTVTQLEQNLEAFKAGEKIAIDLLKQGQEYGKIADACNTAGARTKTGLLWTKSTVSDIAIRNGLRRHKKRDRPSYHQSGKPASPTAPAVAETKKAETSGTSCATSTPVKI